MLRGYFRGGFIFASQSSRKFPLQYINYRNENNPKLAKLSPHEFPNLAQNCENICMYAKYVWRNIEYTDPKIKPCGPQWDGI